jgi:hypothetical protein
MMSSSYLSRDAAARLRFLKTADLVSKEPWELTGAADCLRQWVDLWHQLAKHLVDSQPWTTIRSIVHSRILPIRSSNKMFTICAIQTMLCVYCFRISQFIQLLQWNKALNCHYVFIFSTNLLSRPVGHNPRTTMTGKNGSLLHFPSGGLQWMSGLWVWPQIQKGASASDGSNLQGDYFHRRV